MCIGYYVHTHTHAKTITDRGTTHIYSALDGKQWLVRIVIIITIVRFNGFRFGA